MAIMENLTKISLLTYLLYLCTTGCVTTTAQSYKLQTVLQNITTNQQWTCTIEYKTGFLASSDDLSPHSFWRPLTNAAPTDERAQWYFFPAETAGFHTFTNAKYHQLLTSSVATESSASILPVIHNEFTECEYPFVWVLEYTSNGQFAMYHNKTGKYLAPSKTGDGYFLNDKDEEWNEMVDMLCYF